MKIVRWAVAYLALSMAFLAMSSGPLVKFHSLAERGGVAKGRVVRLNCVNHNEMTVTFDYGGREFLFVDSNPGCVQFKDSRVVNVTFLDEDPNVATTRDVSSSLRTNFIFTLFLAIFMPALLLLMIRAAWPSLLRRMYK